MVVHVIWQSSSGDAEDGVWIEIPHFAPKQEGIQETSTKKPNNKIINRFSDRGKNGAYGVLLRGKQSMDIYFI